MATIDDVYNVVGSIKSEEDALYTVDAGGKIVALYNVLVARSVANGFDQILASQGAQTQQFNNVNNNLFDVNDNIVNNIDDSVTTLTTQISNVSTTINNIIGPSGPGPAPDLSAILAAAAAAQAAAEAAPAATVGAVTSNVDWLSLVAGVAGVAGAIASPEFGLVELAGLLGGLDTVTSAIDGKVDNLGAASALGFHAVPVLGWNNLSDALIDIYQQALSAAGSGVILRSMLETLMGLPAIINTLGNTVDLIKTATYATRDRAIDMHGRLYHYMPYPSELVGNTIMGMGESGEVALADNTVAVSVEISDIPAGLSRDNHEPFVYKGLGIISFGNASGYHNIRSLSRARMFFLIEPGKDRVNWAIRPGVVGVLREFGTTQDSEAPPGPWPPWNPPHL